MTTRTTTIQPSTKGMRALVGAAAASLAVLGGVLLWQARPASETTTPVATTGIGTFNEGVAPLGGLTEQYRDEQQAQAARETARVTMRGGMAELYAEQHVVGTPASAVTTLGGLAEHYAEEQAEARAAVARLEHMGGMAELYRDHAATASGAR